MFTEEEEKYIQSIINIKMRRLNSNRLFNFLNNVMLGLQSKEEMIKMKKQILKNRVK
jgi:hypothetical protein